jgi:hypothetical protein
VYSILSLIAQYTTSILGFSWDTTEICHVLSVLLHIGTLQRRFRKKVERQKFNLHIKKPINDFQLPNKDRFYGLLLAFT